jgi:phage recombination protein Bet
MTDIVKRDEDTVPAEKLMLLRNTIARGSTPHEFDLFVQVCNRLRLDPFARQVFLVKRGGTASPQVSIDGFRLVAERTGQYRGQTVPQWCGQDGVWADVWLADEPPAAARCGVFRDGFSGPLVRVAKFKSYFQRNNPLWTSMPEVMLYKCAEMGALRAAFPHELSGVYGVEEMEQAPKESAPPSRRTLDDVADVDPTRNAEPGHVEAQDVDPETGEVTARPIDEHGLPIPSTPCPVVTGAGKFSGASWRDLPIDLLTKMYAKGKAEGMPQDKLNWCEYLITMHACKRAGGK